MLGEIVPPTGSPSSHDTTVCYIQTYFRSQLLILQELIEKTRERQSARLSEISWAGRTVQVKNEQIRTLLVNIEHNAAQLAETTSDEHKLSLYESMMKSLVEAQLILRDDCKDDPVSGSFAPYFTRFMFSRVSRCVLLSHHHVCGFLCFLESPRFFPPFSKPWKDLENKLGPGESWKMKLKVLERRGTLKF